MRKSRFRSLALALGCACAYACTGNTGTLNLFPDDRLATRGVDAGASCAAGACNGAGSGGTPGAAGGPNAFGGARNSFDAGSGAHRAAECRTNDDCTSGDRRHCLGARCVECVDERDCSGDTPACVPDVWRCEECSSDAQCDDGKHCNVGEGKCQ